MRPCRPDPVRPKEPDLTPRQRWIAAQRLAAGDTIRMTAVMANTSSAVLSLLLNEDPEFQGLIEDCRAVHAMSRDEWRARAEAYARDAAERAMVDGRVSTLNLCLKTTGLLAGTSDDADEDDDPLQAWMDGLSDEEWAEYEAMDEGTEELAVAPCTAAAATTLAMPAAAAERTVPPPATLSVPAAPVPIANARPSAAAEPVPSAAVVAAGASSCPASASRVDASLDRLSPKAPFPHLDPSRRRAPALGSLPPSITGPPAA
jgi:hypothetical protein